MMHHPPHLEGDGGTTVIRPATDRARATHEPVDFLALIAAWSTPPVIEPVPVVAEHGGAHARERQAMPSARHEAPPRPAIAEVEDSPQASEVRPAGRMPEAATTLASAPRTASPDAGGRASADDPVFQLTEDTDPGAGGRPGPPERPPTVSSGAVRSRQTLELTLDPEGLTDLIGPRTAPIGGEQSRQMPMPRPIAVPDDPPHAEETVPRLPAREAVASPPARDGGRPEAEIRPVASPRVPPPAQERGHAVGSTTVIPDARQRAPEEPTRDPSGVRADIRPPDRSTQPPISAPLRILAADGPEHRAAGAGHLPASEQAAVREVPTAPAAERGRPSSSPPPHPFEAPTPGQTSDEDVAYPRRAEGLKDGRAPAETGAPRFGAAVQEPRPAPLPDRGEPIEPPRRAMLREGPAGDARSSSGHVPARAPGAEIHRPSLVAGEFGVPESAGLRVPPASEPAAAVVTIREPARISPVELAAGRTQRLVVEVDPPELGRCELQLSLREGQVRATLIAERPETAMTLRAVESQVREQLAGQNLQVAEFDVRFTARGGADHGAHRGDTGRSPSRTPARMRPSDDHSRAPRSEPGSSTIDVMA